MRFYPTTSTSGRSRRTSSAAPMAAAYAAGFSAIAFSAAVSFGGTPGVPPADGSMVLPLVAAAALFGSLETSRRFRRAREALRRYVPDAVARRILHGDDPTEGECEVSMLSVDLCNYMARVESRTPEQIYTLLGLYILAVSRVIQRHGGSVIEFSGDGMMAVFGAPDPLPDKERKSVEAATAIVDLLGALARSDRDDSAQPLQVGIGIATGRAFVGVLPAADRVVWSAFGNTTNLAARLQAFTRELDASIVVDETTRKRVVAPALTFTLYAGIAIRGLTRAIDVYALDGHSCSAADEDIRRRRGRVSIGAAA